MNARTHDAFAFTSLITLVAFKPPESLNLMTLVTCVVAADVGSLIPDMDQAGNKLWDLLPAGNTLGRIFKRVFYKHRTITHSILGVLLIYKFFAWFLIKTLNPNIINPYIVLAAVMVGYISHLIADAFTKEGLPLLFPLKINIGLPPIKALRIKTGKWVENLVIYPGIWIYVIAFIHFNQERLLNVIRLVR